MFHFYMFRTKNDRAEQFSKRMHREQALTKIQKEDLREKHMRERDQYEEKNLGNFTRAYPSHDSVSHTRD